MPRPITNPANDFDASAHLEWLDVDGRGGYASGTAAGLPTRRYHAWLVVARHPPHQRLTLVNHLAETIETPRGNLALSTRGIDHEEDGWRRCVSFVTIPFPTWTFELGDGIVVERALARIFGSDTACVRWRLVAAPHALVLRVRPMLTCRNDHDVTKASDDIDATSHGHSEHVSWQPHADFPRVHVFGANSYEHDPAWVKNVSYPIDHERGEAWREDWWSPGELSLKLEPEKSSALAFSAHGVSLDADTAFAAEAERRALDRSAASGSRIVDCLRHAARSYEVDCGDRSAILAGFPWFDVWTRDTFTAFTGIFLATGRFAEGRKTLATFAPLVVNGMLPANLPDATTKPRFNAADASFWFIVCVGRYVRMTNDASILDECAWKAVREIIAGHCAGTPPHIRVDTDGLVHASAPDQALTWMDADYQGHVMTPRRGKPVEIQALWIHALDTAIDLAAHVGDSEFAERCRALRDLATSSFRSRFWNEKVGFLYDVIDGPDGDDPTLRPNQIFAVALRDDLVPLDRARKIVAVVNDRLLTPYGLRTLPTDHPNYHPHYVGDQAHRDPAYHQGTVWPYLLGPFVAAWRRVHGDTERTRGEMAEFLRPLEAHLDTSGCLGHIAEIFDGDAPHQARGCFAQAWSAGELLAAMMPRR